MTAVTSTDLATHRPRPAPTPRLPDQVDIRFGDIPAIARFIVRSDRKLRDHGIRLSLSTDFDEFTETNRRNRQNGWFGLMPMFLPHYNALGDKNAFWLKGVDDSGGTVLAHAMRLYIWPHTTFREEAESLRLVYDQPPQITPGNPSSPRGEATAPTAAKLAGRIGVMGALWLHPHYRGHQLAAVVSPLTRAVGLARWYPRACCSIVFKAGFAKGRTRLYGWPDKNVEPSVRFFNLPGWEGPDLDCVLCYRWAEEVEAVIRGEEPPQEATGPKSIAA